jgi:hypothetical protein
MMHRAPHTIIHTYRRYLATRFDTPVLKVPVHAGFSCPNRDGTLSSNGCIFCDNAAFSPVAHTDSSPVQQLQRVIDAKRHSFTAFLPYLQPYTNTYADVDSLRRVYEPLVAHPLVIGIAIGTRPDCLDTAICDYLATLARRTYVCVELGLQSAHDETLSRINRGHTREDFIHAVERLHSRGIETAAHVILGLPEETGTHTNATAALLARLPVQGVKLHQLMVIRNTALHAQYTRGEVTVCSREAYARMAAAFIARLRPDQHIHRLMADARPAQGLVAPAWSAHKNRSIQFLYDWFERQGITQGCRYRQPRHS